MGPTKRGSDGSYSSFSSSSSTRDSSLETRKYLDPWDLENAMYVRGKRISFASDPSTYSAASAALDEPPCVQPVESSSCYCGYDSPANSYVENSVLNTEEALPSMKYLSFCPYCDVQQNTKSLAFTKLGDGSIESCEECSACSSVAPPPPLLLFSNAGGRALSAAGLQTCLQQLGGSCKECEQTKPSFSPSPRRFSVPAPVHPPPQHRHHSHQQQLAYVYESPRARAKHSLPAWDNNYNSNNYIINNDAPTSLTSSRWTERSRRVSLAPSTPRPNPCDCGSCMENERRGPHARLLEPPRHPCRWGMARTGHVAIDYTNAWMSLARRIKPSRT